MKEKFPVDERHDFRNRYVLKYNSSQLSRYIRLETRPINLEFVSTSFSQRNKLYFFFTPAFAKYSIFVANIFHEIVLAFGIQQIGHGCGTLRSILHIYYCTLTVFRFYLQGRVQFRSRGASDEQWNAESGFLHFSRYNRHLFEGRSN